MSNTKRRVARPLARALTIGSALPLLAGCYSYSRVPVDSAPLGEDVRLVVTRDGAMDFLNVYETQEAAPTFVGNLEGRESGSLLVRVPVPGDPTSGPSSLQIQQMVRVPMTEVLSLERRTLDPVKTGAVIAGATALGTIIILQILDVGRNDKLPEGEDPDFSIGLFRVPIG